MNVTFDSRRVCALALFAAFGCDSPPAAPPIDIRGQYNLISIDGKPLPQLLRAVTYMMDCDYDRSKCRAGEDSIPVSHEYHLLSGLLTVGMTTLELRGGTEAIYDYGTQIDTSYSGNVSIAAAEYRYSQGLIMTEAGIQPIRLLDGKATRQRLTFEAMMDAQFNPDSISVLVFAKRY